MVRFAVAESKRQYKPPLTQGQWIEIRKLYHAGQLSVSEIGRQFSVSETAIRRMAKKYGWQRDLAPRVNQEVRLRLVVEDEKKADGSSGSSESTDSNQEVRTERALEPHPLAVPLTPEQEQQAVQQAAAVGVEAVRRHRKDLRTGFALVDKLMNELNDSTDHTESIREMIESEDNLKRRIAMLRAVSLPQRAGVMRDLAMAISRLMPLERQAFNLDENPDGETYEQKLRRLMADG